MESGIYSIEFGTNSNSGLEGLVVIQNGTVNGGDNSYLYRGTYTETGNSSLAANLTISHYRGEINSIFGYLEEFKLRVDIQNNGGDRFQGRGVLEGFPNSAIYIKGVKQANLSV